MVVTRPTVIDGVANSGASNHTTPDALVIWPLFDLSIPLLHLSLLVMSLLLVTSVGDMVLPGPFYLNNILVTPVIIQNILYVRLFKTDNWCSMEFDPFGVYVMDKCIRNVITRCNSLCTLYTQHLPTCHALHTTPPTVLVASSSTYHRRLGHLGPDTLSKLSNAFGVVCNKRMHEFCHAC
jgi:hypothetical protein